jgi:DNA-binding CsgD family transcriptional regulator
LIAAAESDDDLIDLIYAAAVDPSLWRQVMERAADRVGGEGACMARLDIVDGTGEAITVRADPQTEIDYHNYFHATNVLTVVEDPVAYRSGWKLGVCTDEDALPRDEFVRSEYFNDFLRPQDIDSAMWIRLEMGERVGCAITWGRSARRGRFEAGDLERAAALQPHMVRAYNIGRDLYGRLGAAQDVAQTLEASADAVFMLDRDGVIRRLNRSAERLLSRADVVTVQGGRLAAIHGEAPQALHRLIGQATRPDGLRCGGSMSLHSPGRRLPLALRVAPMSGRRLPIFDPPAAALVTIIDLERGLLTPEEELRQLFGLTLAEARTAAAVFEGLSLPQAAEQFGVSINTVRTQLALVFDKTGVTRQAELVKLMMRLSTARS